MTQHKKECMSWALTIQCMQRLTNTAKNNVGSGPAPAEAITHGVMCVCVVLTRKIATQMVLNEQTTRKVGRCTTSARSRANQNRETEHQSKGMSEEAQGKSKIRAVCASDTKNEKRKKMRAPGQGETKGEPRDYSMLIKKR
ncbi:hypothetical protein BC940DRAFT_298785 [Gongronella butleri]|nr:hypothetical protein BC940DRAFT_298785 [Gongronella butleri]